ncbi:uncharacterized protein [Procambarus clarkii]|uniref:uncharacterized protein n=1 Tax=Procambarus clarkii TaxID=6728 RepID=UPI0037421800
MKTLVILAVACSCSAQLVLPYGAPWVLPSAKLEGDAKSVALHTPYINPFAYSFAAPYATPYSYPFSYPLTYSLPADATTLKATEFPYVYQEEKAVEQARRRRRDVAVTLPQVYAVPTVAKTKVETTQFEPVKAATPADTTKIELTTKEHEFNVPAVKYVQPVVNLKPVTYSPVSTAFPYAALPYTAPFSAPYSAFPYAAPYHALPYTAPYAALPYNFAHVPVVKFKE